MFEIKLDDALRSLVQKHVWLLLASQICSGHKIDICQGLPSVNLGVRVILTWFPSIPVAWGTKSQTIVL